MDAFVFTDHMGLVSNRLWKYTAVVGSAMCFFVLLVITGAWLHPVSRPHLDRVSFRLVTYALLANTIFCIANAVGGSFTGPSWTCGLTIFILQLTLEISSYLIFCIALNLQLVIVHCVNGMRMEKYYIIGTVLLSLAITIPPYVSRQYGWDPLLSDCWYANDDPDVRLAWQIGTQLFWTILAVVGECCAALTVILYMLRVVSKPVIIPFTSDSPPSPSSSDVHINLANRYRRVILRIGLYPLASCIINITSVACDIRLSAHDGIQTRSAYFVLLLSDFIYGGRAIMYALLAATDPSLLRALTALYRHSRRLDVSSNKSLNRSTMIFSPVLEAGAVHVELTTVAHVAKSDPPSNKDDHCVIEAVSEIRIKRDPESVMAIEEPDPDTREAQNRNAEQEIIRRGRQAFERQI